MAFVLSKNMYFCDNNINTHCTMNQQDNNNKILCSTIVDLEMRLMFWPADSRLSSGQILLCCFMPFALMKSYC